MELLTISMGFHTQSIAYIEKGKTLHALIIDVARQDEFTASLGRGAYLNNRRIRVISKKLIRNPTSNSSHDTDKEGSGTTICRPSGRSILMA